MPPRATQTARVRPTYYWPLAVLILVVAFGLRTYELDTVPPALYFDEGYYGLDALRSLQDGQWRVFYGANNGREPLFIYLLAASYSALGVSLWSQHLVSAFAGVIAVAATYRLTRTLLSDDIDRAWVAWLAAAALATQLWPVLLSRDGFRAFLAVPASGLTVWLLWRSWIAPSPRRALVAGIAVGLSLYTYLTARVLPVVWALFVVLEIVLTLLRTGDGRRAIGSRLRDLLIIAATALVVFGPLALFFAENPALFAQRAGDVSILNGREGVPGWRAMLDNAVLVARMFVDHGDLNPRHNFPGRPALDALWAVGFWAGLAVCAFEWRRPTHRWLLLWLGAMLAPTLISTEAPHFLRSVGAMPPIMVVSAIGLWRLALRLNRVARFAPIRVGLGMVLLGLTVSGVWTSVDYFGRWATDPALNSGLGFETPVSRAAAETLRLAGAGDVIVSARLFHHPAFRLALEAGLRPTPGLWADRDAARSLSRIWLAPTLTSGQSELGWVALWLQSDGTWRTASVDAGVSLSTEAGAGDGPFFETITTDSGLYRDVTPPTVVDIPVGDDVLLWGYEAPAVQAVPGDTVTVRLFWKSLAFSNRDHVVFAQLQSVPDFGVLGQFDRQPLEGVSRITLWRPGEVVVESYTFVVPPESTPGKLIVITGLYEPTTLVRLPVTLPDGSTGDHVRVGVTLVGEPASAPQPAEALTYVSNDVTQIRLEGASLPNMPLHPGDFLDLTLMWRTGQTPASDYTVFVHLLNAQGELVAQADSQPMGGRAPTSLWQPLERIRDPHALNLPTDLATGEYRVAIGLYNSATGERLAWLDEAENPQVDNRIVLPTPVLITTP